MVTDASQELSTRSRPRMLKPLLVVGIVLLVAYGAWVAGLASSLKITVEGGPYSGGEIVSFWVENNGVRTIKSNPCVDGRLERMVNGSWRGVSLPNKSCFLELGIYRPGNRRFGGFALPEDLKAGTYRVIQEVQTGFLTRRFPSNSFKVQ